jgi:hypothetical protein
VTRQDAKSRASAHTVPHIASSTLDLPISSPPPPSPVPHGHDDGDGDGSPCSLLREGLRKSRLTQPSRHILMRLMWPHICPVSRTGYSPRFPSSPAGPYHIKNFAPIKPIFSYRLWHSLVQSLVFYFLSLGLSLLCQALASSEGGVSQPGDSYSSTPDNGAGRKADDDCRFHQGCCMTTI